MKTGIEMIAAERERQITAEGWSAAHDDEHNNQELSIAAECYSEASNMLLSGMCSSFVRKSPRRWPWDLSRWKPSEDPIRNLVKAGALIAAEIDRLKRKGAGQ